jgi:hypothetical protein
MNFLQKSIAIAVSTCPMMLALPALAGAPAISLAQRTSAETVEQCVASSTQAMQKIKIQEMKSDSESVRGFIGDASVMIFCNEEKMGLVQTIVVAGSDLEASDQIVEDLKRALP